MGFVLHEEYEDLLVTKSADDLLLLQHHLAEEVELVAVSLMRELTRVPVAVLHGVARVVVVSSGWKVPPVRLWLLAFLRPGGRL